MEIQKKRKTQPLLLETCSLTCIIKYTHLRKTENLTLHYKRTLEVSGLENGEDSQQLSSFSKESSSWNANFCLSAWDIRDTGSQGESSLFLL